MQLLPSQSSSSIHASSSSLDADGLHQLASLGLVELEPLLLLGKHDDLTKSQDS